MTNTIEINDWVDALDGIAQVLEINLVYKEEYPLTSLPPVKSEIGKLLNTIIIHKIFCDFEGKLRKKNIVKHCSLEVCTPICIDSKEMLTKLKLAKPRELEKFELVSQTNDFSNYINTWIKVKTEDAEKVIEYLNKEFNLSDFMFSDIIAALKFKFKYQESWDYFTNITENTSQIVLKLNNTNYRFKNKKAIFTDLQAIII